MSTALNISGFRFQVTSAKDGKYTIQIERGYAHELIVAYGTLECSNGAWVLMNMTFEEAHPEVYLQDFFISLLKVRVRAYPELIQYYTANRQPDIFEAIDKVLQHRQAI